MFKYDENGKKVFILQQEESLQEMSIAELGDWTPSSNRLWTKSLALLKKDWKKIETIEISNSFSLELYKMNSDTTYMLGSLTPEGFITVFHIELSRRKDIEKKFKQYKNIHNVNEVIVDKKLKGNGFSDFIYKYLVNHLHFTLLGDESQYYGARKLWRKLSTSTEFNVDIIDIKENIIIEKNVILHHGEADNDFDKRLWNYKEHLKDIRAILTKVL